MALRQIAPVTFFLTSSLQSNVFAFQSSIAAGHASSLQLNQKYHLVARKGTLGGSPDDITESLSMANSPGFENPLLDFNEGERLFSNLRLQEDGSVERREGSTFSATALVFGTTVGAGVLALPAITIEAGFLPSTAVLVFVWVYMAASGLLIAEVNLNTMAMSGRSESSILSMVRSTLGEQGALLAGLAYVFIHYTLLVAYVAQGGAVLDEIFLRVSPQDVHGLGSVLFTGILGGLLFWGSADQVDATNNAFVTIVLSSFAALVVIAGTSLNPELLQHSDWSALPHAVPTMFVALVFHNVVPAITYQLEGDKKKITTAIVAGSGAPLLMFILWNAVILGKVDPSTAAEQISGSGVFDPLAVLRSGEGGVLLGGLVSVFSEFAIATSFFGFVIGLKDFAGDVLRSERGSTADLEDLDLPIFAAILVPPLALAILCPGIFFGALDYAGTFGISILFGVVPALMAWSQRYSTQDGSTSALAIPALVPGARWTLAFMVLVAFSLIADKLVF